MILRPLAITSPVSILFSHLPPIYALPFICRCLIGPSYHYHTHNPFRFYSSSRNEIILSQELRYAYERNETDGILALAPSLFSSRKYSAHDYVTASFHASQGNKIQFAGTINALVASCPMYYSPPNDEAEGRQLAWDIFSAWEERMDEIQVYMDIVTYCSTFTSLYTTVDEIHDDYDVKAEKLERIHQSLGVLDLTRQFSKKQKTSTINHGKKNSYMLEMPGSKMLDEVQQNRLKKLCGHDFDVLSETKEWIVINKPSGMVCYHKHRTSEGRISKGKKSQTLSDSADISLEDALAAVKIPLSGLNPDARGIVHRLDRGTSGCIIIAKNDSMHAKLVTAFFTRQVTKIYLAVIPLNPLFDPLKKDVVSFPSLAEGSHGIIDLKVHDKPALSEYTVLKVIRDEFILLKIVPHTGRYHQVRVHCALGLGRPILLDPDYDTKCLISESISNLTTGQGRGNRFFLHCESLVIETPQLKLACKALMPRWWNDILI